MDKSYVTMTTCPICQKENGELLLDMRLRKTFEMRTPSLTPCKDCNEKCLKEGILLIENKTGSIAVVKESYFKRAFNKPVPKKRIAFVEQGMFKLLGIIISTE